MDAPGIKNIVYIRIGLWGPNAIVPITPKRFRLVVLRCKTDNYYRKGNLWVLIGRLAWALPDRSYKVAEFAVDSSCIVSRGTRDIRGGKTTVLGLGLVRVRVRVRVKVKG